MEWVKSNETAKPERLVCLGRATLCHFIIQALSAGSNMSELSFKQYHSADKSMNADRNKLSLF